MDTTLKGQDIAANPIIQGKNNNNSRKKKQNKKKSTAILFKKRSNRDVCPWDVLGIEIGYNK